jgi:hypothetical protein
MPLLLLLLLLLLRLVSTTVTRGFWIPLFLYGTIGKGGVEREEKGTAALAWLGRGRYYLIIISVG